MPRVRWPLLALMCSCLGYTELLPGDQRHEGELDASARPDGGRDAAAPDDAAIRADAGVDGGDPPAEDAGRDAGRVEGPDAEIPARDAGVDAGGGIVADGGVDGGFDGGVPGLEVHDVAVGVRHACAIVGPNRDVACWGHAANGGAGVDPSTVSDPVPPTLLGGRRGASSICAGNDFTCVAREDASTRRSVACWGVNGAGQLGGGTAGTSDHEAHVIDLDAVAVGCGVSHACAITADGLVHCWGANEDHQISPLPSTILGVTTIHIEVGGTRVPLEPVGSVVAGIGHTCVTVLGAAIDLWCWGRTAEGQTFRPRGEPLLEPTDVISGIAAAVSAAARHTCAWTPDPGIVCSGLTSTGDALAAPPTVTTAPSVLAAGSDFGCVLVDDRIQCWGTNNIDGQLSGPAGALTQVVPLTRPIQLAARSHTACAILTDGSLHCWGDNDHGQVGAVALGDAVRTPYRVVITP